jgi:hypothetical protein
MPIGRGAKCKCEYQDNIFEFVVTRSRTLGRILSRLNQSPILITYVLRNLDYTKLIFSVIQIHCILQTKYSKLF